MDEPTTGLHFSDIQRLMSIVSSLVERGNTVLIIEHHLDVIANAHYLIDLGPEGGDGGGQLLYQ
jgi:excinuclease ABC subunit A